MGLWQAGRRQQVPLAAAAGAVAGSAFFFIAPFDVPLAWAAWPLGMGLVVWGWQRAVGAALLAAGLYLALAVVQVQQAALPWQALAAKSHWMDGVVASVETGTSAGRVTLDVRQAKLYAVAGQVLEIPVMRVGVPASQAADLQVGQGVAAPVRIYPPEAPAFAEARDYRLYDYLRGYLLRGYVVGRAEPSAVARPPLSRWQQAGLWLETVRIRVRAASAPYADGVLTALLVADQRQIPASVRAAYRDAGLSHLLAVSGLQLTLVGVGVFWLVRRGLALWPWLALRLNIKALAALAGLVAAAVYAVLAGAPVSVQRALLMVGILLLAAVLGRLRSLPRAWAVALLVVLAVYPAAVMQAGFQLSFAAVGALILLGLADGHPQGGWAKLRWLWRSSVVAAWATVPFLALTFGTFNMWGVVANLLAIPAMGPITLLAFGGLLVMPLGWQALPWRLAGEGAGYVNQWAQQVAAWPWASVALPAWLAWGLLPLSVAMLVLVLSRWRWGTLVAFVMLLAVGLVAAWRPAGGPELLLLDGGKVAVWHGAQGVATLWNDSPRVLARWQAIRQVAMLPEVSARCDAAGCVYETPLGKVVRAMTVLPEDCALAALVVGGEGAVCQGNHVQPERFAHARLNRQGLDVTPVRCQRPWHVAAAACWKERTTP